MTGDGDPIDVRYLAERPELLSTLVAWFEAEWEPYYGAAGPGNAGADLTESMNRTELPMCLVALDQGGTLAGTISLRRASISHPELGPWAAAFLVAPGMRGRGVGTRLVAALEEEALRLGFEKLYISTDAANGIVERRGWKSIDTAQSLRGLTTVYELEVSRSKARQRHRRPPSAP